MAVSRECWDLRERDDGESSGGKGSDVRTDVDFIQTITCSRQWLIAYVMMLMPKGYEYFTE
jgi:hypothetical protein